MKAVYRILFVCVVLTLPLMAGAVANGSIPPAFVAQQQDRAMRVYCEHWRRSGHKEALEGDEVRRVVIELQILYPTVFPLCREARERFCQSWLQVLVESLRQYGRRGLWEICPEYSQEQGTLQAARSKKNAREANWKSASRAVISSGGRFSSPSRS